MRLRWKKVPPETGLAAISRDSRKRSSDLTDGTVNYASVSAHDYSVFQRDRGVTGWYWVAFESVTYRNTCNEAPLTQEEAKAQAMAYVKKHLKVTQ